MRDTMTVVGVPTAGLGEQMDERFQRHSSHGWWWYGSVVISLALLGGLLACLLSLLAVQRAVLPPLTFDVAVGPVEVSAPCPSNGDYCPPSPPDYTIWLMVRRPGAYTGELYQLVTFTIDTQVNTNAPAGAPDNSQA